MSKYDSIINLPHYEPVNHKRMSINNRSAQFAPFAALTGYNEAILESSRLTSSKIELTNELKLVISDKLNYIKNNNYNCNIIIRYFIKDKYKEGGSYKDIECNIKKIDNYNKKIILFDNTKINIDDIINIDIND